LNQHCHRFHGVNLLVDELAPAPPLQGAGGLVALTVIGLSRSWRPKSPLGEG